jgi:phosphate transport system substrate-binding protein
LVRRIRNIIVLALVGAFAFGVAACGDDDDNGGGGGGGNLSGKIAIDGSSTVLPFAQAAAELFNEENPDVKITVGSSGTGGGFEKFCAGETDISDASRPIKPD